MSTRGKKIRLTLAVGTVQPKRHQHGGAPATGATRARKKNGIIEAGAVWPHNDSSVGEEPRCPRDGVEGEKERLQRPPLTHAGFMQLLKQRSLLRAEKS